MEEEKKQKLEINSPQSLKRDYSDSQRKLEVVESIYSENPNSKEEKISELSKKVIEQNN